MQEICPWSLRLGGFGVGLLNDVSQIPPRPTPDAMTTKFETKKSACMYRRYLRNPPSNRGFRVGVIDDVNRDIIPKDPKEVKEQ